MEKSVTVRTTKEKVSNSSSPDLYDDILLYILSKLPLKSIKRFGCVCKSWSLLFENPYFMAMFRNNFISTYSSDEYLILCLSTPEFPRPLYSLSGFEKLIRIAMPDTDPENLLSYDLLYPNSINGILCFREHCAERQTVLWNPATKEVKLIPPPSPFPAPDDVITLYNVLGFGYDHVTNDYKLIRYVYFQRGDFIEDNPPPIWEIYSVRSNSGRKLGNINMSDAAIFTSSSHVYLDGVCHWLFIEKTDSKDYIQDSFQSVTLLASFDLSNEVTFETPLPLEVAEVDPMFPGELGSDLRARVQGIRSRIQWALDRWLHLVALNGSITLIHHHKQTAIFNMSILGELGGKEPWTKLFVIGPLSFVDYPIGVGKELAIFFRTKDGQLARFDFRTQMIGELGLQVQNFNQMIIYKESFLPIGGISS